MSLILPIQESDYLTLYLIKRPMDFIFVKGGDVIGGSLGQCMGGSYPDFFNTKNVDKEI